MLDPSGAAVVGAEVHLQGATPQETTTGAHGSFLLRCLGNEPYQITVDGYNKATGNVTLHWNLAGAPANDLFANAQVVSGSSGTATGSNAGATKEPGEPNHAGNSGGASIWYAWTASSTATVSIDTSGSSFDTLLGIYTGSSVGSLTTIASNDDKLIVSLAHWATKAANLSTRLRLISSSGDDIWRASGFTGVARCQCEPAA